MGSPSSRIPQWMLFTVCCWGGTIKVKRLDSEFSQALPLALEPSFLLSPFPSHYLPQTISCTPCTTLKQRNLNKELKNNIFTVFLPATQDFWALGTSFICWGCNKPFYKKFTSWLHVWHGNIHPHPSSLEWSVRIFRHALLLNNISLFGSS